MDPEPVHAYNAALQCISKKHQACNQPCFVQESAGHTSLEDGSKPQRVEHVGNYAGTKTKQLWITDSHPQQGCLQLQPRPKAALHLMGLYQASSSQRGQTFPPTK